MQQADKIRSVCLFVHLNTNPISIWRYAKILPSFSSYFKQNPIKSNKLKVSLNALSFCYHIDLYYALWIQRAKSFGSFSRAKKERTLIKNRVWPIISIKNRYLSIKISCSPSPTVLRQNGKYLSKKKKHIDINPNKRFTLRIMIRKSYKQ